MSNPVEWLSNRESDYCELRKNEKDAINSFFLIWSYFESQALDCKANRKSFKDLAKELEQKDKIRSLNLNKYIKYFQERYIENEVLNYRFEYLHLEKSGNPEEVPRMLLDIDCDNRTKIIGCLYIIYRYRNNLFHGPKWRYFLSEQQENMEASCSLLIEIMDNL